MSGGDGGRAFVDRWIALLGASRGEAASALDVAMGRGRHAVPLARAGFITYGVDIRLDANESWRPDEVVGRLAPLGRYRPSAIEQPVAHAEVGRLAEIRASIDVPVMLDESLCGYPDGERAVGQGTADFYNVRLSKCGGYIPSLKLAQFVPRTFVEVNNAFGVGDGGKLDG